MAAPAKLTRKQLYEKVWSQPVRTVAREFGLSDVGLKKICARNDVPTPGLGYWAKVAHGHRVDQTPLPELTSGKRDIVVINPEANQPWQVRAEPEPDAVERERLAANLVKVNASGEHSHSLVRFTEERLKPQKTDGWLTAPHGCLDVRTSRLQLARTLRIMDALLTACESRGWKVVSELPVSQRYNRFGNFWHPKLGWIKEPPKDLPAETGVLIRGQFVAFSIVELSRQAPPTASAVREWRRMYPYGTGGPPPMPVPNGELLLEIASNPWVSVRRRFHDLSKKPLENQLNAVIVAFLRMAAGLREVALKNALERRRDLLAARRKRDAELRRKELEQRVTRLQDGIERWEWRRRAQEFLAFAKTEGAAKNIVQGDFAAWISWAEGYVEDRGFDRFFDSWRPTDGSGAEASGAEGPRESQ